MDLTPLTGENLDSLEIRGVQLSDEQVRKLQQALPNCSIVQ
jgi:hypothetical protein